MEDIKVGQYVRTKNQGIFRISHINHDNVINEFSRVCVTQNGKVGFGSLDEVNKLAYSFDIEDLLRVRRYCRNNYIRRKL